MRRETAQRKAIEQVFRHPGNPLSIAEIIASGRKSVRTLNQATVYRNLKILVEDGWLKRINHPSLGTLWERTGKGHHHHFYCHVCRRFFELPGCALDQEKAVPSGFIVEDHEVFISGTCRSCSG